MLSSSASAAKSSTLSDETLTISGGVKRAYSGTMWSMKYSMPFPGSPIDWMMPASVSAMRGVGLPSLGSATYRDSPDVHGRSVNSTLPAALVQRKTSAVL